MTSPTERVRGTGLSPPVESALRRGLTQWYNAVLCARPNVDDFVRYIQTPTAITTAGGQRGGVSACGGDTGGNTLLAFVRACECVTSPPVPLQLTCVTHPSPHWHTPRTRHSRWHNRRL